ncbi:MAG: SIMPL domain-containing protein [Bacteroidota bacterium]
MFKIIISLIIGLFLLPLIGNTQDISPVTNGNTILVIAEGNVDLPGNRIAINLHINAADQSDPTKAYARYHELEMKLVDLLHYYHIPDTNVHYSLLTVDVQGYYDDRDRKSSIVASQFVNILLDSIDAYTDFQMKLISEGFQNLNASFYSTEQAAGEKEAMKRAIRRAKEKAAIFAVEAGRKLGKILRVSDTEENEPRLSASYRMDSEIMKYQAGNVKNLVQIPQMVTIHSQVKVLFEMGD